MATIVNKLMFKKNDPLRDLHVPKKQRKDEDEGPFSDATDELGIVDDAFDRDEVRNRGGVVSEDDLQ